MKHVSRIQEDRNREQLLTMRFTTNAASRSPMQAANGSDTSLLIDGALDHRGALDVSTLRGMIIDFHLLAHNHVMCRFSLFLLIKQFICKKRA